MPGRFTAETGWLSLHSADARRRGRRSLISGTRSRVAAAAAWLGVGFVMVVAVACWARGAPACGEPSVGPQSVPCWLSRVYASLRKPLKTVSRNEALQHGR
jgi:hypothetical protein